MYLPLLLLHCIILYNFYGTGIPSCFNTLSTEVNVFLVLVDYCASFANGLFLG